MINISTRNFRHVTFDLPTPPADPARHSIWQRRALAELKSQLPLGHRPMIGFIRIKLRAGIDDERLEISRATDPIAQLLIDAGVISGPISDTDAKFDRVSALGRTQITISDTVSPRSRVPAIARKRAGERGGPRRVADAPPARVAASAAA